MNEARCWPQLGPGLGVPTTQPRGGRAVGALGCQTGLRRRVWHGRAARARPKRSWKATGPFLLTWPDIGTKPCDVSTQGSLSPKTSYRMKLTDEET